PKFKCLPVSLGQRAELVHAMERAQRRLIQCGHAAGLYQPDIVRRTVAQGVEVNISAMRSDDVRVNLIQQPVVLHRALHGIHVPSCMCPKSRNSGGGGALWYSEGRTGCGDGGGRPLRRKEPPFPAWA